MSLEEGVFHVYLWRSSGYMNNSPFSFVFLIYSFTNSFSLLLRPRLLIVTARCPRPSKLQILHVPGLFSLEAVSSKSSATIPLRARAAFQSRFWLVSLSNRKMPCMFDWWLVKRALLPRLRSSPVEIINSTPSSRPLSRIDIYRHRPRPRCLSRLSTGTTRYWNQSPLAHSRIGLVRSTSLPLRPPFLLMADVTQVARPIVPPCPARSYQVPMTRRSQRCEDAVRR